MSLYERLSFRSFLVASALLTGVDKAFGQTGQGSSNALNPPCIPGLPCNSDTSSAGVKTLISKVIVFVLDFLGLIAVLFIIIAGIRLIVSQGEEEQKEKAKKTILYVIIGLIIILFARVIVSFVTGTVPGLFGAS